MGTRGIIGFFNGEETKVMYNHYDSYPEWLGIKVLEFLRTADMDIVKRQVKKLKKVGKRKPTLQQQEKLAKYADTNVSTGSLDDWYVLLRKTQGDMQATLDAGFYDDGYNFTGDSLLCEWGYVINLVDMTLEIYKGFQDEPHSIGRFHDVAPVFKGYYPIKLVATYSLDNLPSDIDRLSDLCLT